MTVRVTPRGWPGRTDLYAGVTRVWSDGRDLLIYVRQHDPVALPLGDIAEIALDAEPGFLGD